MDYIIIQEFKNNNYGKLFSNKIKRDSPKL